MNAHVRLLSITSLAAACTFVLVAGQVSADFSASSYHFSQTVSSTNTIQWQFPFPILQAWCGNGIVEANEACDDGNMRSGDGCTFLCKQEAAPQMCDGTHAVGDQFLSPDGCNSCVCTENGTICTLRACAAPTPPPSPAEQETPSKCVSSDQCSLGQYCTTEDGDCQSACEPGADACIMVCAGVCKERDGGSINDSCKPIICPSGSEHPSCSADGHPIYYFADPCQFS